MARADNLYSRFVAWGKVVLPLAAIGLVSALFLVGRGREEPAELPFSEGEIAALARDQGILAPHYTGLTADGRALSLTARTALPRRGDRSVVDAERVTVDLETGDAGRVRLTAARAAIDTSRGEADLAGGVVIETAQGWRVVTEEMWTALERTDMESRGPATVTGPGVEIESGRLAVHPDPAAPETVIVVFMDGVRAVYTPEGG